MPPAGKLDLDKWVQYYRLHAELESSPAAKQARAIVFGAELMPPADTPAVSAVKRPVSVQDQLLAMKRGMWLSEFKLDHPGRTEASIYQQARVFRSDFTRWKHGAIKESSVLSGRIAQVIRPSAK